MGILLAFAVGYVVGVKAGSQGLEEIVSAIKDIRASEEFAAMVGTLRSHVSKALRDVGEVVGDDQRTIDMDGVLEDVVARARRLAGM